MDSQAEQIACCCRWHASNWVEAARAFLMHFSHSTLFRTLPQWELKISSTKRRALWGAATALWIIQYIDATFYFRFLKINEIYYEFPIVVTVCVVLRQVNGECGYNRISPMKGLQAKSKRACDEWLCEVTVRYHERFVPIQMTQRKNDNPARSSLCITIIINVSFPFPTISTPICWVKKSIFPFRCEPLSVRIFHFHSEFAQFYAMLETKWVYSASQTL